MAKNIKSFGEDRDKVFSIEVKIISYGIYFLVFTRSKGYTSWIKRVSKSECGWKDQEIIAIIGRKHFKEIARGRTIFLKRLTRTQLKKLFN